ncbi:MAG TPA: ATP synthase F0 subunit B [Terriglobales bacterium]|jgi:F-type H+-transporting ATPase subunit b|nr:ATP synthase F0 subunit B [Terriglobales bacterium]
MSHRRLLKTIALMILAALFTLAPLRALARAQEDSAAAAQSSSENRPSHGAGLAKDTHEAAGEEEENESLTHSATVQYLARKMGITVHQAHLVAISANFLIIVVLICWFARKSVPGMLRSRTESIQRALEEGRAASQEANRRLADIEARLGKLDTEIASMQAQSEKEAAAEESRIKQAAEEDIRKVVQAAEQEIASAAKQARRELSIHTADLAVALARKQIHVDANSDQALVRTFAANLSSGSGGKDRS